MHHCLTCGAICYCDGGDHENPMPANCNHQCDDEPFDEDGEIEGASRIEWRKHFASFGHAFLVTLGKAILLLALIDVCLRLSR